MQNLKTFSTKSVFKEFQALKNEDFFQNFEGRVGIDGSGSYHQLSVQ